MMTFSFNQNLRDYFNCDDGAYSEVTVREADIDRQITVSGPEKELVVKYINDIKIGSVKEVKARGENPSKPFRVAPSGDTVSLNLVYPKPGKGELRLYLQGNVFKPNSGDYWFVFVKDGVIWLGSLDKSNMEAIIGGAPKAGPQSSIIDFTDAEYQEALYLGDDVESGLIYEITKRIKRNPLVARKALEISAYKCEINPEYPFFMSKYNNKPFLEAHHLIPVSQQPFFEKPLDVTDNICILNPLSHRLIHHGQFAEIKDHLLKLSDARSSFLTNLGINKDRVLEIYNA